MNRKHVITAIIMSLLLLLSQMTIYAEPTNYTYNYDFWSEAVASPDAYAVSDYLLGSSLGTDNLRDPQGLFVKGNIIYIVDSGNNRIVVVESKKDGTYELKKIVSSVWIDGNESSLSYPMDVFESDDGKIYICDTNNQRILCLDKEWNYINAILKPNDQTFDVKAEFLPTKLVVDFAGRIFVQARNINKGLMEFDMVGDFVGYIGANKVEFNPLDYFWKMVATKEQRATMDLFIPTEYNNLALDSEGFIYVTNSSNQMEYVRRLNAMGSDILIRNGYEEPLGDLQYSDLGNNSGTSKFVDVAAFDNDSYVCFDRVRGRLFFYDFQGNLLYTFGGLGNREGYFTMPVAVDKMGYTLFALDSSTGVLTRFDLTEYGQLINLALDEYKIGHYDESALAWEEVLKLNGNYDLAYIGIGRTALRQGEYEKAMKYFKAKYDRENYGKAYKLYRKQWMEENMWKMLLIIGVFVIVPPVVRFSSRIRKEVMED